MKNKKMITIALGVCAVSLIAAQSVLAAETFPKTAETKGTIQFGADDVNKENTTVPDENDNPPTEIHLDPDLDGTESTEGSLRLQFVPHFNFGTYAGFTAQEAKKNAQVIGYSETVGGTRIPMAPFVQVAEFRGAGSWKLDVKSTPFVSTTEASDILTGAYINLPGSTLTMERHTTAEAKLYVKGQQPKVGETKVAIQTDGTATRIMESIPNTTATGYKVSNVFHTGYTKGMTYVDDETSGVEFVKPAGKTPTQGAVYQSTLTWTLANTL